MHLAQTEPPRNLRRPILLFNSPKQVQARLPDQCTALATDARFSGAPRLLLTHSCEVLGFSSPPINGWTSSLSCHHDYHPHLRAVAEWTSHCRTPACEGRPPVLGMVARCKALTQSSLTTLSLPLHVAQHHSRGTARDEVLTLPSRPLSRPHARSSGFPRPHVSPGVCLSHILKKCTSSSRSPPGRASPSAHSAVQLAEASPGPFA